MTVLRRALPIALGLAAPALAAAQAPQPSAPTVSVSGLFYGNYQYHTADANRDANQFLLDRAYLTVRSSLGRGLSARVTSDVFQSGDQNGWTVRLKYGYLQHDAKLGAGDAWTASTRAGMLHTVVIEHIEQFWPRWLGTVPTDRFGYFSSADVGVAEQLTLPGRMGELYATVTNGNGYTRRETDRYKDVGVRLSLTPLAGRTTGMLSTLAITGWGYKGAQASRFALGGTDQVGEVSDGLRKDRYGAFVGLRDHRLTGGLEYSVRDEEAETGANTVASPRRVSDVEGSIRSAFLVLRPLAFASDSGRSRFALVGRWDDVKPGTTRALADADERLHYLVAGAILDVTPRLSVALDYQEQLARRNLLPESKTFFAHFVLNF